MTDELLRKAAQALREETDVAEDSARFTRARVMTSVHKSELKRRTRIAFALPIAACFVAATAWGTVNGKTQALISEVSEALGFEPKPAAPPAPKKASRRATAPVTPSEVSEPSPAPAPAPAPAPESESAPAPAPTSVTEPAPQPRAVAPRASQAAIPRAADNAPPPLSSTPTPTDAPPPPAPPAAKPDISDRAHELYRTAHQRHFVEHSYAAALSAWDAYLSEAPGGRFALEARYNRALCLVRLGRSQEARAALTPFAAGQFGAYRKREAQALMDALP